MNREAELIVQVKMLLEVEMEAVKQLELIDDLQNLGLTYFFQDDFNRILSFIYNEHKFFDSHQVEEGDLYFTALGFKLLRQHGFDVSAGAAYIILSSFFIFLSIKTNLNITPSVPL